MEKPTRLAPTVWYFIFLLGISNFWLNGCSNNIVDTRATQVVISEVPSRTSAPTVTQVKETVNLEETKYICQLCPLSFSVFDGWSIQEFSPGEPGSISMDAPTIELVKEQYKLAITCFVFNDQDSISPGGRGAGENVALPDIEFIDKLIHGEATVWEDSIVSVLYTYRSDMIVVFVDLGPNPYVPYQEFNITEEIISEVTDFMGTVSLTDLPDIPFQSTPEDYPSVFLPMDDVYHSQIDDTELPNACAPTAGYIILDYLKRETSLEIVADQLMMEKPERGGYDPTCERNIVCTSPMTLAQKLSSEYQITIHTRQGWTFDAVHDALIRGHPIIADILWRNDSHGLGHFVVIFGIDKENELIYYHDPVVGPGIISSWQDFSERWAGPVDVGDPTYPQGFQFWGMEVYIDIWENESPQ